MDNWDNMRFLLALYRHKTMSAAAIALETNVATVSRRVERTAKLLGAPLFVRDATGWVPTDAARPLLRVAEDFSARLSSEANNRAAAGNNGIEAHLQIVAPAFFHNAVLVPQLHKFLARHPGLELTMKNRNDAIGLGDADIMLRVGRPESGRVVARRLVTLTFRAYRSTLAETRLDGWVAIDPRGANTLREALGFKLFGCQPKVAVTQLEQKLIVMRSTGLAGIIADEVARDLPDMVPVDAAGDSIESEIWMIYHATRRDDQAIRAATDWIVGCFRAAQFGRVAMTEDSFELAG
jgi:DNA-binding transcriptional LysR family regulator